MAYPELVLYKTENDYRQHHEKVYCSNPILTFDRIQVRFRKNKFHHCFFESTNRNGIKDKFSRKRAELIDWIKAALEDPDSERYVGWDRKRNRYDKTRRVTIVQGDYVIVIHLIDNKNANFITAYVADKEDGTGRETTLDKIRKAPKWK